MTYKAPVGDGGQKYLAVTVDVEAMPTIGAADHVDRLIWGRIAGWDREVGIGRMMDIADEFGVKFTFFLDVLERNRHGQPIEEAAHEILSRGHDLQLHIHREFLPEDFWSRLGYLNPTWGMHQYNDEAARLVVDYAVETFVAMTGRKPLACRVGAFRYNRAILRAIEAQGMRLSYHYYPVTSHREKYPHGPDAGILPVFRWSNGLIEIPTGCLENPHPRKGLARYAGFARVFGVEEGLAYMEKFFAQGPEHNVLVMLLHSWSLMSKTDSGLGGELNPGLADIFRFFIDELPANVKVVTAPDLLRLVEIGGLSPAFEMPLAVAGTEELPLWKKPK
ncbi:MAG: hypothetical protein ABFD69_07490 [Candidatus Sumerlaeia bacterium]